LVLSRGDYIVRKILLLGFLIWFGSLYCNSEIFGQVRTKTKSNKTQKTKPAAKPKPVIPKPLTYTIDEIPNENGKGYTCVYLRSLRVVANNRDNWSLSVSFCHKDDWSDSGKFNLVEFTVSTISTDWKYGDYAVGTIMADGEKLYIYSQARKPVVRNDRLVQENIMIYILSDGLLSIARARRVDLEIGIDKYQLPSSVLAALRDFSTHMSPAKTN
jgi:hypothetical protein